MPRALLIDDEAELKELVQVALDPMGLTVTQILDGEAGLAAALGEPFDVILLDLNLPKLEGVEVCKRIRERNSRVPILMLTSVQDQLSKVLLLELGADDYITKPFSQMELKARVKAVLRRSSRGQDEAEPLLKFDDIEIDFERRLVKKGGAEVELTRKEFELLAILAANPGRPFSRDELNNLTSGYESSAYDHSVTSHINRLRTKLEKSVKNPEYILTVHGVGYKFKDLE